MPLLSIWKKWQGLITINVVDYTGWKATLLKNNKNVKPKFKSKSAREWYQKYKNNNNKLYVYI